MRRKSPSTPAATLAPRAIFLVGFMGAGKTTVGRALGQRLNWIFEDLDDRIEHREGRKIAEIFRESGECAFRQAERAALEQVRDELRGGAARVIALGGGAFVQPENAALLKTAAVPVVFLDAPVEALWERCRKQVNAAGNERPLLASQEEFRKLYQARRGHYANASMRVDTGDRSVEAIAEEIARTLRLEKIVLRTEEGEGE